MPFVPLLLIFGVCVCGGGVCECKLESTDELNYTMLHVR